MNRLGATTRRTVKIGAACRALAAMMMPLVLLPATAVAGTDITTYHGNLLRSGWNRTETMLTPATVASQAFGLLRSLDLDDQVDAQPLVMSDQPIQDVGVRDVVYVATESNSVYAFDAETGEQLLHVRLGSPVPQSLLPGKCHNNASNVGITGTPTIDVANETMYVVAYALEEGAPVYRLHALDLRTLRDRITPALVIKGVTNANQVNPIRFDAATNRQRAGLTLANGNIYVAFASFCDLKTSASRGWMLGWQKDTLKALPTRPFIDRKAAGSNAWFLSSIWMSGAAPAADRTGRIYLVTGNADPKGAPSGERELSESVAAVSGDLRLVSEYFTPHNRDALDEADLDFGAGGVMLLPLQDGPVPHLATAAGKDGTLYLLDRDHMGGFTPQGPDKVLGKYTIGRCFCVQSYFTGADGVGRIVTSGGNTIMVWRVENGPQPRLRREIVSHRIESGQYPGFMTMVSSNGSASAVIWAVSHPPDDGTPTVMLHAFDAANATRLFSQPAGTWPNLNANANIMPVVANGKVFVASYRSLSIFGLRIAPKNLVSATPDGPPAVALPAPPALADRRLEASLPVGH